MDRSPGFGSINDNLAPYSDSVSLRLPYAVKLAAVYNSLTHYTKGTQSPESFDRAPTACTHTISESISLPYPGFFSPFPHGTCSLSVGKEYLALEDGPPIFSQDSTCPGLLFVTQKQLGSCTGLSPCIVRLSSRFHCHLLYYHNWAFPISLATTFGISVDFFSSGYLDVSVPRVRLCILCIQIQIPDKSGGLPHSEILGSMLVVSSPRLIADYHVLPRLLPPRHSSYALLYLTI